MSNEGEPENPTAGDEPVREALLGGGYAAEDDISKLAPPPDDMGIGTPASADPIAQVEPPGEGGNFVGADNHLIHQETR